MPSSFRVFATSLRAVNVFPFALGLPLINKTFIIDVFSLFSVIIFLKYCKPEAVKQGGDEVAMVARHDDVMVADGIGQEIGGP